MDQKKKNAAWANCCEDWGGYMAAKKAKLEEQFQEAAQNEFSDASKLFNGIAIFVNGYTNPNADELKRLMMAHGGIFHHYLRPQGTTHMIASNLPYSKIVAYRKAQNPLPLCKPEWIVDSIKEGKLLDYKNYLLYSQCTKTQPSIFAQMKKQNNQNNSEAIYNGTNLPVSSLRPSKSEAAAIDKKSEIKVQDTKFSELSSVVSNCTKNPAFLTEFYNNSRLHHISTMGAMFKDYINELRDKSDGKFPGLEALKQRAYARNCKAGPSHRVDNSDSDDDLFNNNQHHSMSASITGSKQVIMHIDMDCFFVSVGLRNHPELKGIPVAVAHAKGNKQSTSNDSENCGSMSEVASCSYEARKAGVKNGMLLGQALKLCPNLKTIRYDFDSYKEVSYTLYDTVASYTLNIEAVSCDEMYADCTGILQSTGLTPLEFASIIRSEIKGKTGCPVSTGFGENKLQARLATKKAKPDGQCYLKGDDVRSFLRNLNVRDLPGVGYSTSHKLRQMNVENCADLEAISLYELQKEFGKKNGQQLHEMCRGIDNNKLNLEHVRKSVSAEVNYGIRFDSNEAAHEFLKKLSEEVSDRLKKINSKGKSVTLKVLFRAKEAPNEPKKFMGHGLCDAFNKSKNLIAPTDDPVIIAREVLALWNQFHQSPEDARGIGIQITKLESSKNKPSGSTLLKFIDRMKAPEKNSTSSHFSTSKNTVELQNKNFLTNTNTELQNENFLTNTNSVELQNKNTELKDSENLNSRDTNEITLSLEDQLLSEEMRFSDENSGNPEGKSRKVNLDEQEKLNDEINRQNVEVERDKSQKPSSQLKQTKQSEFFKETKPFSSNRSGKVKLPDIQEIDMKVLIELPEDIRNEILNEYKENKDTENSCTKTPNNTSDRNMASSNLNRLEKELSFSQIDPDFLAALPEDVKNDVKSYCDAQKKEKRPTVESKRVNNIAHRGWDMFKNEKVEKKPQKNGKTKSGKLKVTKNGGKKDTKNNAPVSKIIQWENELLPAKVVPNPRKNVEVVTNKESTEANKTVYFSTGNEEHTDILTSLVNCLLELPVSKVKLQIQEWIDNSSDINDVDFLSLTTYLGTLPRKQRLEDLHVLLKCLYRCVMKTESCVWHETYTKMLGHIQARMRLEYGNDLMIPNIKCFKCDLIKE